jgi:hypothetical protein
MDSILQCPNFFGWLSTVDTQVVAVHCDHTVQYTDSFVPTQSVSTWFGSLRPRKIQPNSTAKTLQEQVPFSLAQHGSDSSTSTTPCTADVKAFASSHYTHLQVYLTPSCSPPHHASQFQSTALAKCDQLAQTLMRHQRWDMAVGSCFLQYAQYTEASLLQHFTSECDSDSDTTLHTSIATFASPHYCLETPGDFSSLTIATR